MSGLGLQNNDRANNLFILLLIAVLTAIAVPRLMESVRQAQQNISDAAASPPNTVASPAR